VAVGHSIIIAAWLGRRGPRQAVPRPASHCGPGHGARGRCRAIAMAVTGRLTRSMFDRYTIVYEDDLRMAAQKTTMYVDTLPTKRVSG
jgi:hypothetical protein